MFSCCWALWWLLKFCMVSKEPSGVTYTLCSFLWYLEAGIIRKCPSVAWDMWTPKQPVVPKSLLPLATRAASAMCLAVTFEKAGPFSFVIFQWHSWRSVCLCVWVVACVPAKLLQSRLTLRDPLDYSPPGSSVHGILQARKLKWVVIPFSRGFFPIQGWSPSLLQFEQILYLLSH